MESNEKKTKTYNIVEERLTNHAEEPVIAYGAGARRYSYADYLTWLDDKTREIINGIVKLMSPAPTRRHAGVVSNISFELGAHIRRNKGKCHVYTAPFDVRLPKNKETTDDKIYTVVQPDICVVCDLSKLDNKGCIGAPEIVVEIQSPSTARYDMTDKFYAYEEAGVLEYWIVFPGLSAITIFRLQSNGKFDGGTAYEFDAIVTSQVLEGLEINLEELFKNL